MMINKSNLNFFENIDVNMYKYLYTASIAKEVVKNGDSGNSFGIIIVGMIVVIVGMIGFIITKNNK